MCELVDKRESHTHDALTSTNIVIKQLACLCVSTLVRPHVRLTLSISLNDKNVQIVQSKKTELGKIQPKM